MPVRVILVDDHNIVRKGVRALLRAQSDLQVIGESCCGEDALPMIQELRPDVVILDWVMPGLTGLNVLCQIRQDHPNTRVVILSGYSEDEFVFEALKNGALGYVLKEDFIDHLIKAVQYAAEGKKYISPSLGMQYRS